MTKKSNIIPFPKTNIREVKIKDIAEELETQMIKIKEQRELLIILKRNRIKGG